MKVLVVDDTPENVYLLKALLKGHGYEVSTAANGMEALEQLKRELPALIISDILMPKMDGFQLCREVKADDALKAIPFVFYTATYTTEKDKDFALSLGACRFILKPTDPEDFIDIINEVLAKKGDGSLENGVVTLEKETEYLKGHQTRLIKKLGDKIAELECSEERYRSLISCAIDAIITLDESGMITSWNAAAEKIFGYALDEVIGKHFSLLVPEELRSEKDAILLKLKEKKQPGYLEAVTWTKKGDFIPAGMSFSLMKGRNHQSLGFSMIIRDMTERNRLDLERQRLIAELEKRNAELERFTYTVSHDLKTPLVTILGFIGQLEQDLENDERDYIKADFDFIESAAKKMHELLASLLELSRAGRTISETQPIDLPALVRQMTEQIACQFDHIKLRITISTDLPVVKGDPLRLREVFQNLLENAAKFTTGILEPLIEVGCTAGDGEVVCFVRDNGIGIPADYQKKVFRLFEKLDQSREGTGVGLAIVRRIVEEHGGRVWVESAGEGCGSTFFFTLPVDEKTARPNLSA